MGGEKHTGPQKYVLALSTLALVLIALGIFMDKIEGKTGAIMVVAAAALPSAATLELPGFKFRNLLENTAKSVESLSNDAVADLESRVAELEVHHASSKNQAIKPKPGEPTTILRSMLESKAYNLRSSRALENATGLNAKQVEQLAKSLKGVERYESRDNLGTVYYGYSNRVHDREATEWTV